MIRYKGELTAEEEVARFILTSIRISHMGFFTEKIFQNLRINIEFFNELTKKGVQVAFILHNIDDNTCRV